MVTDVYKTFLTDYMGTLKNDGFPTAVAYFEKASGIESGRLQQAITRKYWPLWSLGLITEEVFWLKSFEEVDGKLPMSPRQLTRYIFDSSGELYKPMIDFFKLLQDEGIPTVVITNISPELYGFLVDTEKLPRIFNQVVASFQVGERKPSAGIYRTALQLLGVQPREAVYVDNEDTDVKGAEALGITGVSFISLDETVPLLEELYKEGRSK